MKRGIQGLLKERKTLYLVLSIVLISVFSLTIVYAALSVTLNIQGNAEVVASSWDIHLDNIKVTSGSVSGTDPSITSSRTASFSTTLNNPGDFYEFTVDVVNDGSIDAMIDGVSKTPTLTTAQAKYLKYEVEYQNGESINTKQLVSKNSFVRLKVRVEFRKDITASDLPTTSETLNLAFTVNYVQSDGSGSSVIGNGKMIYADGDINAIGTIVTIGSEQFYTIGTKEDNVKLLSMYNLMVGNEVTNIEIETWNISIKELTKPTGMQSLNALGSKWDSNEDPIDFPWYGLVPFSSVEKHGTSYSDYSGSLVEEYVNNYKILLESKFGVIVDEARLITYDELTNEKIGCSVAGSTCTTSSFDWIYSTSYWSGSAYDNRSIWVVDSDGLFEYAAYRTKHVSGVRPVIVISKSYF